MTAPWFGSTPSDLPTRAGSGTPYYHNRTATRSKYAVSFNVANYTDTLTSPQQTARTAGATGFTQGHLTTYASGNNRATWLNSSGTEVLRIRSTATQTFQLQYWNGSTWTAVGSAVAITGGSTQYRYQIDFTGLGTSSGSLRLRVIEDAGETVVMDESASSLDLTAMVNIDRFRGYASNSTSSIYSMSEFYIKDGSALSAYVYNNAVVAGTYVDGTGTAADVDDLNTSTPDTDFISLASSGQRQSMKAAARSFGGRNVKGVGFCIRAACDATGPTQLKAFLYIGGTRYYWGGGSGTAVTLTTSYADYQFSWDTDPSTGAAWAATNAESTNTEFGWEVV